MHVAEWVQAEHQFNGDFWALTFDSAITQIGVFVENRLNELDEKGRPKYRLEDWLRMKTRPVQADPFAAFKGVDDLVGYSTAPQAKNQTLH